MLWNSRPATPKDVLDRFELGILVPFIHRVFWTFRIDHRDAYLTVCFQPLVRQMTGQDLGRSPLVSLKAVVGSRSRGKNYLKGKARKAVNIGAAGTMVLYCEKKFRSHVTEASSSVVGCGIPTLVVQDGCQAEVRKKCFPLFVD